MDAFEKITSYIEANGGEFGHWFVGVAADPKDRPGCEHSVNHRLETRLVMDAGPAAAARPAQGELRRAHWCRGSQSVATRPATPTPGV